MECVRLQKFTVDGKKVKVARAEKDWTITLLAEKSGVTRKTIGQIERGTKRKIRWLTLLQLAETLEKPLEYFCTRVEEF